MGALSRRLVFLGRLVQEDRLTIGASGVVFVLCFCLLLTTFSLELDELTPLCIFDQLGTLYEVHPPRFCRFSLGLFGLVAFLLLFLLPLGGWVPLAVFSLRFPLFLGWVGVCVFCFFGCALLRLCISSVGLG